MSTNFSSSCELMLLLQQLDTTFREFKVHESIENKYIMQKLKEKLQRLSITNKAVCNCHKDHKLTQMLRLLEDGHTKCSKSDQDRVNYGIKLRMALDDFTEQFIPHMQEEEEVRSKNKNLLIDLCLQVSYVLCFHCYPNLG